MPDVFSLAISLMTGRVAHKRKSSKCWGGSSQLMAGQSIINGESHRVVNVRMSDFPTFRERVPLGSGGDRCVEGRTASGADSQQGIISLLEERGLLSD